MSDVDDDLSVERDREQARRLLSVIHTLSSESTSARSPAMATFEERCRDDAAVVLRRIAERRQAGR